MKDPAFIIQLRDETTPREVRFQELYNLRHSIINMTIMWDFNSYFVNITDRYIIVNGGRRVKLSNLTIMEKPKLYYRRRHTSQISVANNRPVAKKTAYVLGAEGMVNGETIRAYILIEEDGSVARIVDNEKG